MDIVNILTLAIDRLPVGDHSPGLNAILRHVSAAIRHFDRKDEHEADTFTDAIYRTNQAFEGSLKEAYRVLSSQDPSGKSTYEIETYLEENDLIRPRVLKQLTRYRQDYRNPSTHDYNLDFDENEALLAILSVCAFSKLLVDQISSKLAYDTATLTPTSANSINLTSAISNADELVDHITKIAISVATDIPAENDLSSEDFDGLLAGTLVSHGMGAKLIFSEHSDTNGYHWDILVNHNGFAVAIETRWGSSPAYSLGTTLNFLLSGLTNDKGIDRAMLIARADAGDDYAAYDVETDDGDKFRLVSRSTDARMKRSTAKLRRAKFNRWHSSS